MNVSIFAEYLAQLFPSLKSVIEKYNGKREKDQHLFKTMLRKEYSVDLKWESTSVNGSIVAADVVALDSELPLKKRDKLSGANGTLPKLGMKLALGEKQITDLNIMKAKGEGGARIAAILTNDAIKCTNGVDERLEEIFLTGLSEGVALVPDGDNVGVGIRVDYGYLDKNKYTPTKNWGASGYTPISDVERVISDARDEGAIIRFIMLDKRAYNLIRTSEEGRLLGANYLGHVVTSSNGSPAAATPTNFNAAFKDEYGVDFILAERVIKTEKNGVQRNTIPWSTDKVVFLTSNEVGKLVYGSLAEETNPVQSVLYSKANEYTLIAKYSKNDPLREFTSSQALVLPVIENVDQIYQLDIDAAASDTQVEDNATFDLWGYVYTKEEVLTAMGTINRPVASDISDADLLFTINGLSAQKKTELKAVVFPFAKLTPAALSFTAAADTTGQEVTVDVINGATATVTADETADWCTLTTLTGGKFKVKVTANNAVGAVKRTADITVTSNSKAAVLVVTQEA